MLKSIVEIIRVVVTWLFSASGYREWRENKYKEKVLSQVERLENEYAKAIAENRFDDADRVLSDLKRMRGENY